MASFLDEWYAEAVVRLRLTTYFRSWHQNQHSKSFLLMCGLHKQIMNGLMTIDLHLSKAENQGRKKAFFFLQPDFSQRYYFIKLFQKWLNYTKPNLLCRK